jgi:hypothetical protein
MFFLLRLAFWLCVVLVLLPTVSARHTPATNEVAASDAISAASATVRDLQGFCGRQPDACTVGSQVATEIGYRAQAGAKMLYDFLTQRLASRATKSNPDDIGLRGSIGTADPEPSSPQQASQNTLTPADLAPVWRGPVGPRDAKPAA